LPQERPPAIDRSLHPGRFPVSNRSRRAFAWSIVALSSIEDIRVDISREELAERFRALSDEELLSRLDRDLTPLALEVAIAELQSRGIEIPRRSDVFGAPGVAVADEDDAPVDLVTVAEFWNPIEANLARATLESCGIRVFVWGEHLGVAHTFLSVASGGMRVQVRANQATEAKAILAAVKRGDFVTDEQSE
jgi:hypothetical protein